MAQTINISLMQMDSHGISEDDCSHLPLSHESSKLSIPIKRPRAARWTIYDIWIVLSNDLLQRGHPTVHSGQAKLLQDVLIYKDKSLHGRLHTILANLGKVFRFKRWK